MSWAAELTYWPINRKHDTSKCAKIISTHHNSLNSRHFWTVLGRHFVGSCHHLSSRFCNRCFNRKNELLTSRHRHRRGSSRRKMVQLSLTSPNTYLTYMYIFFSQPSTATYTRVNRRARTHTHVRTPPPPPPPPRHHHGYPFLSPCALPLPQIQRCVFYR